MALWLDKNDYDFETEAQKYNFIQESFFDHMFRCPNCGEAYTDEDGAMECCHEDCYEQDKEFIIEERADERLRSEKGD